MLSTKSRCGKAPKALEEDGKSRGYVIDLDQKGKKIKMVKTMKRDIVVVRNSKTGDIVYKINKDDKIIEYFLLEKAPQRRFIVSIKFEGFDRLPAGFYKSGFGLTSKGYYILDKLYKRFNKQIELIVSSSKKSKIYKLKTKLKIVMNYDELFRTLLRLREINQERNTLIGESIQTFLHRLFPNRFKAAIKKDEASYKPNEFSRILNKDNIMDNLSESDIRKMSEFFPFFIRHYSDRLKGKKKLLEISKKKNITEIIYLENIIKEYRRKLSAKIHTEKGWQDFLRKYILFFHLNYVDIIEKQNISLEEKYPDFMLIDVYNYLDIYEIKKPDTNLLKMDKSRGNYYWDTELSKAISQVENYIEHINKNSLAFRDAIRKKRKIDIRVVKPRGFIIAGQRNQLENETMEDNFRLLNKALKNVEVILYDELLDNLENFLARLKR